MRACSPTVASATRRSAEVESPRIVAVAYSGGRDSTALLHATAAAAEPLGLRVLALHVHHGLSPNADAWLAHAERTCRDWARAGRPVRLASARLTHGPPAGESVEAWAREQRYAALAELARNAGAALVLLAHHRRDQAETLLLQALRGAGVDGLAGMPAVHQHDGLTWARPWLQVDPVDIVAYVGRHRLAFVDDESNRDPRWARSRLRTTVWPVLEAAFPQAEAMLARSAGWAREAAEAQRRLARSDLESLVDGQAGLPVAAWRALGGARARNALRHWLRDTLGAPAPATLIDRLDRELRGGGPASWPCVGGELRLVRGRLGYAPRPAAAASSAPAAPEQPVPRALGPALPARPIAGPRRLRLSGWAGAWVLKPVEAGGVAWERLERAEARSRCGGEQFQSGPGRPPRALKKQFQSAGVDRWHRAGPLLWDGADLLAVPGLGVDARAWAAPGVPQVALTWEPDPPTPAEGRPSGSRV